MRRRLKGKMSFIGRMLSNVASFYKEINSATLTGAIDVLVVEQPDGQYLCSPFHVRFGKMGVMRSREKVVDIKINDEQVGIHMKLGEGGEAFFVENLDDSDDDEEPIPDYLTTSPLPSTSDHVFEEGFTGKLLEGGGAARLSSNHEVETNNKKRFRSGGETEERKVENFSEMTRSTSQAANLNSLRNKKGETSTKRVHHEEKQQTEEKEAVVGVGEKKKMRRRKKDLDEWRNRWSKKEANGPVVTEKVEGENKKIRRVNSWNGSSDVCDQQDSLDVVAKRKIFATGGHNKRYSRQTSSSKKTSTAPTGTGTFYQSSEDVNFRTAPTELTEYSANSESKKKMSIASYYSTATGSDEDDRDQGLFMTQYLNSPPPQPVQFMLEDISSDEEGASTSAASNINADRPTRLEIEIDEVGQEVGDRGFRAGQDEDRTPIASDSAASGGGKLSSSLPSRLTSDGNDTKMRLTVLNPYYHPFSDTEITPSGSRECSRPPTPTKSDPELNRLFKDDIMDKEPEPEWKWGELPDTTPTEESPPDSSTVVQGESAGWGLSSMLGLGHFMRRTRKVRHNPEAEGIYLEDLVKSDEIDPKVAALYFPKRLRKEEKPGSVRVVNEKDPGESSPPSTTADGSPLSPRFTSTSEDWGYSSNPSSVAGEDDSEQEQEQQKYTSGDLREVSLSLCGGLDSEGKVDEGLFKENLVDYQQLNKDPNLLFNENLVVKLNKKYYSWKTAAPMLVSVLAFQQPLSEDALSSLRKPSRSGSGVNSAGGMSSWFYWRRAASVDPSSPKKLETGGEREKRSTTPIPTLSSDNHVPTTGALSVPSLKESVKSDDESLSGSPSSAISGESAGSSLPGKKCKKSLRDHP